LSWLRDGGSVDALATQFARLATEDFHGYSPLYESLTRAMADDAELLTQLLELPDPTRLPINLFAAVHYLVRRTPGPLADIYAGAPGDAWPLFRDLVVTRHDEIAELLTAHTIQTNEVGRCSALVPAAGVAARRFDGRELALVEIGSSAGLNLQFDRYAVQYDDGRRAGPPTSMVTLSCAVVGPLPPPLPASGILRIATREGIDLAPVDVRDTEACAWLEACLWPDVPRRLERFEAAVAIARRDPPVLHRGDAVDLLDPVLDAIPDDHVPFVFSTWALAYLDRDGRAEVHRVLAERARRRDLVLVTAEYPHVTPWVPDAPRPPTPEGKGATQLSMTVWDGGIEQARAVAWMQAHGQWIDWLDESGAGA
jgi:hypothetical protein